MNDSAQLLLELRDIHEPVPPASSSALVLGLLTLFALLLLLSMIYYYFWKRKTLNRTLQSEIKLIENDAGSSGHYKLAVLLRRLMHHLHGDEVNQLEATQWLKKLDSTFSTHYFTSGKGEVFGTALYHNAQLSSDDTLHLCRELHAMIGRIRIPPRT